MEGVLFAYCNHPKLVAFCTPVGVAKSAVILIHGFEEGLLSQSFAQPLNEKLIEMVTDAHDIANLVQYLKTHFHFERIVLCGSSTGCQDIVQYTRSHSGVDACVLQAPVSDREYLNTLPQTYSYLQIAHSLLAEGRGHELLPIDAIHSPITACRYVDLVDRLGQDDKFSSDLTDEEMESVLGHIELPTLIAFSEKDEYVPPQVDVKLLTERMKKAITKSTPNLRCDIRLYEADHSLHGKEQEFAQDFIEFLKVVFP